MASLRMETPKGGLDPMKPARRLLPLFIMTLASASLSAQTAGSEDAKLDAFFRQHLEETLRLSPVYATYLGDHRYDHLLDDVSPEGRDARIAQNRKTLQALPQEIKFDQLSRGSQIDYAILEQDLKRDLWLAENFKPFEEDPRAYGSCITGSVYNLLAKSTLPQETNIANSIARMAFIPKIVEIAKQTLTHPPKPILETAILQNKGAISFYENGIYELAGQSQQTEALKAAAAPIIESLKDYQSFLEGELMEQATDDWRIGKEKFSRKLEFVLDAGMSAEQVLSYAEDEYERVKRDMYVISRQLWSRFYPGETLPPDDTDGQRETTARVIAAIGKEHGKPESLLADTKATVDRIKEFITRRGILTLPEPDTCQIVEMPEFRRGNSIAYLDSAPPFDPKASTYYAVSPPPSSWSAQRVQSFLEEYNAHMLQILTIHEAYPGHYVQLAYANRHPSLIRQVIGSGVYIEGWAVYTEQMMLDEGYGDQDLKLRLMQLKFYLRAVVNAILDYKMHAGKMTDEEAIALMVEGAFQSESEARLKVIRSKQSTAQLSTYFVGRMAHYRLRQEIQREMGDDFNLGSYHEAVLDEGSIPVKFLPETVRARLGITE